MGQIDNGSVKLFFWRTNWDRLTRVEVRIFSELVGERITIRSRRSRNLLWRRARKLAARDRSTELPCTIAPANN